MNWLEIRRAYPDTWLILEALEAHTTPHHQRELDRLAVIETCGDGKAAMRRYRFYHQAYPRREFYLVNTRREALNIIERNWPGIRTGS